MGWGGGGGEDSSLCLYNRDGYTCMIISPPPVKPGGTIGLHSVILCVRLSVSPSVCPSHSFSALFSYILTYIELKFCILFCFTVLHIKFNSRYFASIFVWVIPLLELRINKICSFPHFSPTSFDILSWNFPYDFGLMYYRSSLSVVTLCQFLMELCLFLNLEYTFLQHPLSYWAQISICWARWGTCIALAILSVCLFYDDSNLDYLSYNFHESNVCHDLNLCHNYCYDKCHKKSEFVCRL